MQLAYLEEESSVLVNTWLDPRGQATASLQSWLESSTPHCRGHPHRCLTFGGGACSGAAWWTSYRPQHQEGHSCHQVFAPGLLGYGKAQGGGLQPHPDSNYAGRRVSWQVGDGSKANCHNFQRWRSSFSPVSSLYDSSFKKTFTQYFKQMYIHAVLGGGGFRWQPLNVAVCCCVIVSRRAAMATVVYSCNS
jgi:hypothetical protein